MSKKFFETFGEHFDLSEIMDESGNLNCRVEFIAAYMDTLEPFIRRFMCKTIEEADEEWGRLRKAGFRVYWKEVFCNGDGVVIVHCGTGTYQSWCYGVITRNVLSKFTDETHSALRDLLADCGLGFASHKDYEKIAYRIAEVIAKASCDYDEKGEVK